MSRPLKFPPPPASLTLALPWQLGQQLLHCLDYLWPQYRQTDAMQPGVHRKMTWPWGVACSKCSKSWVMRSNHGQSSSWLTQRSGWPQRTCLTHHCHAWPGALLPYVHRYAGCTKNAWVRQGPLSATPRGRATPPCSACSTQCCPVPYAVHWGRLNEYRHCRFQRKTQVRKLRQLRHQKKYHCHSSSRSRDRLPSRPNAVLAANRSAVSRWGGQINVSRAIFHTRGIPGRNAVLVSIKLTLTGTRLARPVLVRHRGRKHTTGTSNITSRYWPAAGAKSTATAALSVSMSTIACVAFKVAGSGTFRHREAHIAAFANCAVVFKILKFLKLEFLKDPFFFRTNNSTKQGSRPVRLSEMFLWSFLDILVEVSCQNSWNQFFWWFSPQAVALSRKHCPHTTSYPGPFSHPYTVDFIFFTQNFVWFIKSCGGRIDLKFSGVALLGLLYSPKWKRSFFSKGKVPFSMAGSLLRAVQESFSVKEIYRWKEDRFVFFMKKTIGPGIPSFSRENQTKVVRKTEDDVP